MSIQFETITLRGVEQEAVTVTAGQVILKSHLTKFDIQHIDAALSAEGAPAEVDAALAAYTMPNGQTAATYYAHHVVDVADANARFIPTYEKFAPQIKTDLADLDSRVTALEPEPAP